MGWILRLVETGTDSRARSVDVLEISRPNDLGDIANLGLTWPEAKQLWGVFSKRWLPRKPASMRLYGQIARPAAGNATSRLDRRDFYTATRARVTDRMMLSNRDRRDEN